MLARSLSVLVRISVDQPTARLFSLCEISACSAVGHGGLYHSQSPEAYFLQASGVKVRTAAISYRDHADALLADCRTSLAHPSQRIAALSVLPWRT